MKILILGNGGREHALAWKVGQDSRVKKIFVAPGNAGTARLAENLPIAATDVSALLQWAKQEKPDMTIVGPEAPLCAGIVDAFEQAGFMIFGPNQKAAQLEGSKSFTKNILLKYKIPTARAESFVDPVKAYAFSQGLSYPQVIKADGLAAGKGVIIAESPGQATDAIYSILEKKVFGAAGASVLIEEFLFGMEASIHAVTDGETFKLLPSAQDHKRVGDHDTGLNTGGMGAYAPAPCVTPEILEQVSKEVFIPLLKGLKAEGIDYRGILYAGLMLTAEGPKVLEFNARLGDPETQVLLPLLETSLIDIVLAVHDRRLASLDFKVSKQHAVAVVIAAEGYPENPRSGDSIEGLGDAVSPAGCIFHAGTKAMEGNVITAGGRVLSAAAWSNTLASAQAEAYSLASRIHFKGMHYRRDIGAKALR